MRRADLTEVLSSDRAPTRTFGWGQYLLLKGALGVQVLLRLGTDRNPPLRTVRHPISAVTYAG
jgi:hypothetical protein